MELGRECLTLWGYERVDELIWVKTNQLQRLIRTGRTGHWLNHGKEHCLVGVKGNLPVSTLCVVKDLLVFTLSAVCKNILYLWDIQPAFVSGLVKHIIRKVLRGFQWC